MPRKITREEPEHPPMLSVADIAARWGCSHQVVLALIRAGELPAVNLSASNKKPMYRASEAAVHKLELRRLA